MPESPDLDSIPSGRELRRMLDAAGLLTSLTPAEHVSLARGKPTPTLIDGLLDLRWVLRQGPITAESLAGDDGSWPNPLFDPDFYRRANPDAARLLERMPPLAHYAREARGTLRRPSPGFDPRVPMREQLSGVVVSRAAWPAAPTAEGTGPLRAGVDPDEVHDLTVHIRWARAALGAELVDRTRGGLLRRHRRASQSLPAWSGPGGVVGGAWLHGGHLAKLATRLGVTPSTDVIISADGVRDRSNDDTLPLPTSLAGWLGLGRRAAELRATVEWRVLEDIEAPPTARDGALLARLTADRAAARELTPAHLWSARRASLAAAEVIPEESEHLRHLATILDTELRAATGLLPSLSSPLESRGALWFLMDSLLPEAGRSSWELLLLLSRLTVLAGWQARIVVTHETYRSLSLHELTGGAHEVQTRFERVLAENAGAAYPPHLRGLAEATKQLGLTILPGIDADLADNVAALDRLLREAPPRAVLAMGSAAGSELWLGALRAAGTCPTVFVPYSRDDRPVVPVDLLLDHTLPLGDVVQEGQLTRLGFHLPPAMELWRTDQPRRSTPRPEGLLAVSVGRDEDLRAWLAEVGDAGVAQVLEALGAGQATWEVVGLLEADDLVTRYPSLAPSAAAGTLLARPPDPGLLDLVGQADLYLHLPGVQRGATAIGYAVAQAVPVVAGPTEAAGFLPDPPAETLDEFCERLRSLVTRPVERVRLAQRQRRHGQQAADPDVLQHRLDVVLQTADQAFRTRGAPT